MVILVISVLAVNSVFYMMGKQLTKNQIVHIWAFTSILVTWADIVIDEKFDGYWYFEKGIDWHNFVVYALLIPPVNVIFLNWFPFNASKLKKLRYFVLWILLMVGYELIAQLQPWGYFHYGWWRLSFSIMEDPFLLLISLSYYKWICKVEKAVN